MRPSSRRSTSSNGSREDESSVVEQMFVSPIDTMYPKALHFECGGIQAWRHCTWGFSKPYSVGACPVKWSPQY